MTLPSSVISLSSFFVSMSSFSLRKELRNRRWGLRGWWRILNYIGGRAIQGDLTTTRATHVTCELFGRRFTEYSDRFLCHNKWQYCAPPPCGKYGAKYCLNSKKAGVNFAELADCRCRLQKHADAGALFETHWKGSWTAFQSVLLCAVFRQTKICQLSSLFLDLQTQEPRSNKKLCYCKETFAVNRGNNNMLYLVFSDFCCATKPLVYVVVWNNRVNRQHMKSYVHISF